MRSRFLIVLFLAAAAGACSSHTTSPIVPFRAVSQNSAGTALQETADGQLTWTTFGANFVAGMVPGHDGNTWFFDTQGQYGRITPAGSVFSQPFPDSTQLGLAIAPNPDGNVYIGTKTNNGFKDGTCHIYQVHPDTTIVDLISPFACAYGVNVPAALVSGYDQRLWVVTGSATIERITTTDGSISSLVMPEPVGGYIIRGPSAGKAMYAAAANKIYRIAPDDSISSAPVCVYPAVTKGNYVWGTQCQGSDLDRHVIRLSDDLSFTLYRFQVITSSPFAAVVHRDELLLPMNIYPTNQIIFRFNTTTDKFMTRWSDPDANMRSAIIGPDHNLWMSGLDVYVGKLQ